MEHANEASLSLITKPLLKHLSGGQIVIKAYGQPTMCMYIATKPLTVYLPYNNLCNYLSMCSTDTDNLLKKVYKSGHCLKQAGVWHETSFPWSVCLYTTT